MPLSLNDIKQSAKNKNMEWISVNIKPEKNNEWYLVFIAGARQPFAVGYYVSGEFYKRGGENWGDYRLYATHYMPLPESPFKK